jgi:hypothetical protein
MDKLPKDLKKEIIGKLYQDPSVPQKDLAILKLINKEFNENTKQIEQKNKYSKIKKELLEQFKIRLDSDPMDIRVLMNILEELITKIESKVHRRNVAFEISFGTDRIVFEWNIPNFGDQFVASNAPSDKKLILVKGKGLSGDEEIASLLKGTRIENVFDRVLTQIFEFDF